MKKYGFLFGAGAEVAYKLPLGGQFALDIFREDTTQPKELFKQMRNKVDKSTNYANTWLPENYLTKNVDTFRKSVFQNIIMSTVEHKRKLIIALLSDFDKIAQRVVQNKPSLKCVDDAIMYLVGKEVTNISFMQIMKYNTSFEEGNKLFSSHYFSALLEIYKKVANPDKKLLGKIISSIMQLQLGALSEELSRNINDNIFQKRDDGIDILDDFGDLIKIDYNLAGVSGLELLFETQINCGNTQNTEYQTILCFAFSILEEIYSNVLDYKSLIDSNWHYLYCPASDWAKFCKISIFLLTVHQYISKLEDNVCLSNPEGYYNLLKRSLDQKQFVETAITTTNYTNIIEKVLGEKYQVTHFNGSTETWYDPYLNKIGSQKELIDEENHFIVPLLFTQSGTKPMTSINMSVKYVDVYNEWKSSDAIVVIGFGFGSDDEHINNILRTLVNDEGKELIVVNLKGSQTDITEIAKNLKISSNKEITIIDVDQRGMKDGQYWTDILSNS